MHFSSTAPELTLAGLLRDNGSCFKAGDEVHARKDGDEDQYHPGKIKSVNFDGSFSILFDHHAIGEKPQRVMLGNMKNEGGSGGMGLLRTAVKNPHLLGVFGTPVVTALIEFHWVHLKCLRSSGILCFFFFWKMIFYAMWAQRVQRVSVGWINEKPGSFFDSTGSYTWFTYPAALAEDEFVFPTWFLAVFVSLHTAFVMLIEIKLAIAGRKHKESCRHKELSKKEENSRVKRAYLRLKKASRKRAWKYLKKGFRWIWNRCKFVNLSLLRK